MTPHQSLGGAILVPQGCRFSGVASGIKASGQLDLACAEFDAHTTAAAVFTRNRVVAAPLIVGREHLKATHGRIRALIVNSGNANCATGRVGLNSCQNVCRTLAKLLKFSSNEIFPSSTGVIGVPLPEQKIIAALPGLLAVRNASREAVEQYARAIMTTDTRSKTAAVELSCGKRRLTLLGVAKGSGMIHPQLATMLVYLFSDVRAAYPELQTCLSKVCEQTFNCISVDGDTSTNDTVLLAATGASECALRQSAVRERFITALKAICDSLCEQIISDGEGAKHRVVLLIEQASDVEAARRVASTIANSPLVKSAWSGADPNWGRILAAIGRSGVEIDPSRINIFLGPHQVCKGGMRAEFDQCAAHEYLSQPEFRIRVQLGRGHAHLRFLTCDLSPEYVHINANYST